MIMRTATLALASLLLGVAPAGAQSYTNFNDLWGSWRDSRTQLQQQEGSRMQQLMNDPAVQAGYRQHLAQGGQMSFEQYAYYYGATAGFSPDGARRFQRSQGQIARDSRDAYGRSMDDYYDRGGPASNQEAMDEAGNVMQGTTGVYDEESGRCYTEPYTEYGQRFQREIPC